MNFAISKAFKGTLALGLTLLSLQQTQALSSTKWELNRQWNDTEEELFSEFIAHIGEGVKRGICVTTDECLKNPTSNPLFAKENPSNLRDIFSDCADLPHVLRGYFAFMRGLPFVYPTGVTFYTPEIEETRTQYYLLKKEYDQYNFWNRPRELQKEFKKVEKKLKKLLKAAGKDLRYSRSGNKITRMTKIYGGEDINTVLDNIVLTVSTASYRVDASRFDTGDLFKDTYSIGINRAAVKPGTVLYDPAGHIALVAEVTKNGKIYLIDAHPDNSITYISYGEKFTRSPVTRGAGFVNWRPYTYEYGSYNPTPNTELADFSLEQFFGNPQDENVFYTRAQFNHEGRNLDFYHYVRASLSLQGMKIDPLSEIDTAMTDLCRDFQDRVASVNKAIEAELDKKEQPKELPENIYGTSGEWETFSTPSRDARLKASVREIYNTIAEFLDPASSNSGLEVVYNGSNLKADLRNIFTQKARSCDLTFTKSDGELYQMNLEKALDRLFDLSFDPYHCIELRWGLEGSALASCEQDNDKWDWYEAEQPLRNQIDRDYSAVMDYDLRGLRRSDLGVQYKPQISIKDLLN